MGAWDACSWGVAQRATDGSPADVLPTVVLSGGDWQATKASFDRLLVRSSQFNQ